jgi:hypothetical protein
MRAECERPLVAESSRSILPIFGYLNVRFSPESGRSANIGLKGR